ncbi:MULTISPECIES: hypothetical protein [Metabacillus]|uniref:Uncharacterized protein n=4 Tax=Metabacillus TaxID=2675233 RepID=A0A179T138_9BACI|nr:MULTISPECIES: hypothetical protein [Metabacillus]MBO1510821.1 hypothetical protein [Metabacillus bambusae]OAS87120.1 hypothetical protein A6K24_20695 [Metabacillus litoralis]QNF26868.1 hypothetical protein HUW50_04510 [Metabacillus sp. KUDC1714]
MGGQPTFFVLDDKMVAVFSVIKDNCKVKMECLFSKTGIEDYTLEYQGPNERKAELIELAILRAQNIFEHNILTV